MGKVDFRTILFAGIIFSMVFMGLTTSLAEIATNYNQPIPQNYMEVFGDINSTFGNMTRIGRTAVDQSDTDTISSTGDEAGIVSSITGTLKLPFRMFTIIDDIFTAIAKVIHIPKWALSGFIAMITVLIVAIFLSAVLRKDI